METETSVADRVESNRSQLEDGIECSNYCCSRDSFLGWLAGVFSKVKFLQVSPNNTGRIRDYDHHNDFASSLGVVEQAEER